MWKNSPVKGMKNERKMNIEENLHDINRELLNERIVFPSSQTEYKDILEKVSKSLFDDDNDHEKSEIPDDNQNSNSSDHNENNNNNNYYSQNNHDNDSIHSFQSITTEEENFPEFVEEESNNVLLNLPKFEPPPYFHTKRNESKNNYNNNNDDADADSDGNDGATEENIDRMISSIPLNSMDNYYPSFDVFAQYLSLIEESYPTTYQDQSYPTTLTADHLAIQIRNKVYLFLLLFFYDDLILFSFLVDYSMKTL